MLYVYLGFIMFVYLYFENVLCSDYRSLYTHKERLLGGLEVWEFVWLDIHFGVCAYRYTCHVYIFLFIRHSTIERKFIESIAEVFIYYRKNGI